MMTREEWDAMTPDEQWQWAKLMEKSDEQFRDMLKMIPECPEHGDQCIPHAEEWIREQLDTVRRQTDAIVLLEEQVRILKLELLTFASFIFSYSENSELARNKLFYDLWLRHGYRAAAAAGMNTDWRDHRLMFDQVYEEIHKLRKGHEED